MTITLFIRISLFIFSKGVEASVVCETDGRGRVGEQDRLPYRPIISLDHSMLGYLQDPLSTSSASRPGRALTDCKMALTLAFTDSNSLNWRPLNWRQHPPAGHSH